jgi:adenosylcobinamide amidohydrolase
LTDLINNDAFIASRNGRFLSVEFLKKHLVYSTSIVNGGHQEDLKYLLNQQSCEGAKHMARAHILTDIGHDAYHQQACKEASLEPKTTAMMGTAADMQYAAISEHKYKDITSTAIVTAGVTGNACRAGEDTLWHEVDSGWEKCYEGTINIIVLINVPLLPSAICQVITTMNEAKSAALLDLAIPSKNGKGLATGTGTDQFCVASIIDDTKKPKSGAGKHVKLGEIVGKSVIEATKKALQFQNGLEPSYTRSLHHALGRYGLSEKYLEDTVPKFLKNDDHELFNNNLKSIIYLPSLSASAFAIASVLDRIRAGTIPESMFEEIIINQCSLIAVTIATKPQLFETFRSKIAGFNNSNNEMEIVVYAICLGWSDKWKV